MGAGMNDVVFVGAVGRVYRRVKVVDGVVAVEGRGAGGALRPTEEAWASFWRVAEGLGVWRWAAEYGRMIRDGRPWTLELRRGERVVATAGNDYEEHAPVGVRGLMLALDELVAGRLLLAEDARVLRKNFKLKVMVTKESRPPISELVLLRRLFEPVERACGVALQSYTLGRERDGASFLLDEAPSAGLVTAMRGGLAGREPVLTVVDFSTGREDAV